MDNISFKGKVALAAMFFIVTFFALFFMIKGHWLIGGFLFYSDFMGVVLTLKFIHFLKELEKENEKFREEHKNDNILTLNYKEVTQLRKEGYLEKDGQRLEYNGNNRRKEKD